MIFPQRIPGNTHVVDVFSNKKLWMAQWCSAKLWSPFPGQPTALTRLGTWSSKESINENVPWTGRGEKPGSAAMTPKNVGVYIPLGAGKTQWISDAVGWFIAVALQHEKMNPRLVVIWSSPAFSVVFRSCFSLQIMIHCPDGPACRNLWPRSYPWRFLSLTPVQPKNCWGYL